MGNCIGSKTYGLSGKTVEVFGPTIDEAHGVLQIGSYHLRQAPVGLDTEIAYKFIFEHLKRASIIDCGVVKKRIDTGVLRAMLILDSYLIREHCYDNLKLTECTAREYNLAHNYCFGYIRNLLEHGGQNE